MINHRVWHPSRDPYHCAFRMIRLLVQKGTAVELERMRVLDLFLLYPPLLHRTSMPQDVRESFRKLGIPRPEKIFLRLPSAAALFQELRLYQNSAVAQLVSRGLISTRDLKQGLLSTRALPDELAERTRSKNEHDGGLAAFLVGPYSAIPLRGAGSVYRKAGLPARAIAA